MIKSREDVQIIKKSKKCSYLWWLRQEPIKQDKETGEDREKNVGEVRITERYSSLL